MRVVCLILIVFAVLIAPFSAQAAVLCKTHGGCSSVSIEKSVDFVKSDMNSGDSGKSSQASDCGYHCPVCGCEVLLQKVSFDFLTAPIKLSLFSHVGIKEITLSVLPKPPRTA